MDSLDHMDVAAVEKRLVRKLDRRILPLLCISYLLNYIDRTNLGNARTLNNDKHNGSTMTEMLDITPSRYTFVVAIFFVPYIIFELPSNFLLKRFGPKPMMSRIMIGWGIVTMSTAACKNYAGIVVCRVALAIAEAGFFPGVIMYFCFWYKAEERGARIALFLAFVSVSGAIGGLVATACSYLNDHAGLKGWQWLYLLEGIPAILFGIVVAFFLPNFPDNAKFLTEEERTLAIARLGVHAPKMTDKHLVWKEVWDTIRQLDFWLFATTYYYLNHILNAFSYFAPTLISGFGFKGAAAQALIIPPNVFGCLVILSNSWWSDRRKRRPEHILGGISILTLGHILLITFAKPGGRYVGILMMACANSAVAPLLAFRTTTVSGATATAVASAGIAMFANISGITAPFTYSAKWAPRYIPSLWISFGFSLLAAANVCILWYRLGPGAGYKEALQITEQRYENNPDIELKGHGDEDKNMPVVERVVSA